MMWQKSGPQRAKRKSDRVAKTQSQRYRTKGVMASYKEGMFTHAKQGGTAGFYTCP
ncbi:Leu/Phe-tRNA-protein transferase [Desulfitispora alkaliphila]|uniref:hypothetical protein n=1 Tax=Desulfitispora alkaliphila TaxID=622674 RepID=UPI003D204A1B